MIVVLPDHIHFQLLSKKKIQYSCEGMIEKYVPRNHGLSSLDKPRDAISYFWERFFYPILTIMMDSYRILNQNRCHEKGFLEDLTI